PFPPQIPPPPTSPPFPYTTLFRSKDQMRDQARAAVLQVPGVSQVDVQMSARVREAVGADGPRQTPIGVKNVIAVGAGKGGVGKTDRKSTRLNSSHVSSSYAVFCLK